MANRSQNRQRRQISTDESFLNLNMENVENLEIVKSIAESYSKLYLIGNIQRFYDKETLQVFTVRLQVDKST